MIQLSAWSFRDIKLDEYFKWRTKRQRETYVGIHMKHWAEKMWESHGISRFFFHGFWHFAGIFLWNFLTKHFGGMSNFHGIIHGTTEVFRMEFQWGFSNFKFQWQKSTDKNRWKPPGGRLGRCLGRGTKLPKAHERRRRRGSEIWRSGDVLFW